MSKILISIPTYNRSHYLKKLLSQIKSYQHEHEIAINIIDDASNEDYNDETLLLPGKYPDGQITIFKSNHKKNYGKKQYWKTVNEFCGLIEVMPEYDYYYYLPDDFILCDDFFNQSIKQWENIQDDTKICLSLFIEKERMNSINWVDRVPDLIQFNEYHYYRSQWMDMCIISTRKFYEALKYKINKVNPKRWADFDAIGSGVGPQITKRLNKDYSLYHVSNSLCYEEEHESKMNPNRVQSYTIQCNRRDPNCKVHVGIASVPERENMLQRTVESLIYQADRIYIHLNNYKTIPEFLNHPKITVFTSQDLCNIDLGDSGKLSVFISLNRKACPLPKGYYFSCDDDIIYPGDYVYNMINFIENNNRKAVIGLHGVILNNKVKNYYKDRKVISCLKNSTENTFCHILGTGAMAFHTDTVNMEMYNYGKNICDICFGMRAQQYNIPMLCVRHDAGWLTYMEPKETIFDTYKNDCSKQTELVNSIKWKIHTIEGQYKEKPELELA
jgi:hypothetical protein